MIQLHTQRVHHRPMPSPPLVLLVLMIFAIVAVLLISQAHAQNAGGRGIEYLAGGVGSDEMERLKSREGEFNLKLVFTLAEGNYLSDVAVVVKNREGNPVLVLYAPGPLVLARLPRGAYVVEATYAGKAQARKVDIRDRLHTEYMRWPSDPQADFPGPKATERE